AISPGIAGPEQCGRVADVAGGLGHVPLRLVVQLHRDGLGRGVVAFVGGHRMSFHLDSRAWQILTPSSITTGKASSSLVAMKPEGFSIARPIAACSMYSSAALTANADSTSARLRPIETASASFALCWSASIAHSFLMCAMLSYRFSIPGGNGLHPRICKHSATSARHLALPSSTDVTDGRLRRRISSSMSLVGRLPSILAIASVLIAVMFMSASRYASAAW